MGKVSGLAIVCGCFLMVLGLAFLPAAFGTHPDESILGLGICVFSLGALTVAGGLYMKAHALKSGTIFAAGLDVTDPEPPDPNDPLLKLPNLIVAPHIASATVGTRGAMAEICANNLGNHYDFRSCAYVPSTRRTAGSKAARFAAKA